MNSRETTQERSEPEFRIRGEISALFDAVALEWPDSGPRTKEARRALDAKILFAFESEVDRALGSSDPETVATRLSAAIDGLVRTFRRDGAVITVERSHEILLEGRSTNFSKDAASQVRTLVKNSIEAVEKNGAGAAAGRALRRIGSLEEEAARGGIRSRELEKKLSDMNGRFREAISKFLSDRAKMTQDLESERRETGKWRRAAAEERRRAESAEERAAGLAGHVEVLENEVRIYQARAESAESSLGRIEVSLSKLRNGRE